LSTTNEIRAELHAQIDRLALSSALDASDGEAMRSAIIAALAVYTKAVEWAAAGELSTTVALSGAAPRMAAILLDLRGERPTQPGNRSFLDGFEAGRDAAEAIARKRYTEARMSGDRIAAKVIANAIHELSAE
jgi:acetyl-CoA acetyltransferase